MFYGKYEQLPKPRIGDWVVVGNMRTQSRNGKIADIKYTGTRMFSRGTRLYLGQGYWGMGQSMHVIGLRRISRDTVNCIIEVGLIENPRPTLIYSKSLIQKLEHLNCVFFLNRSDAVKYADYVTSWIQNNFKDKKTPLRLQDQKIEF